MYDGNTQYTGNPYIVCHKKNCFWQKFCLWVHSKQTISTEGSSGYHNVSRCKKLALLKRKCFFPKHKPSRRGRKLCNTLVIFCNFGTLRRLYNEMDHEIWCSCLHFKQVCFWSITTCTKIKLQRYNKMNSKGDKIKIT